MTNSLRANCYRPVWSDVVLEELRRNLVGAAGMTLDAATRRIARLTVSFPDASAALASSLPDTPGVDAKDRHVVAAAIAGKAVLIVTNNLRHFPARALSPLGIEAWEPDRFLLHLRDHLSRHTPRFSEAARRLS